MAAKTGGGKKSVQRKHYCLARHELTGVLTFSGGRRKFEWQCECNGYKPMDMKSK